MAVGVTVRIKGGDKIRRFVFGNINNPTLAAQAAYQVIQRVVMPALRSQIPERSGRLKRSLRLQRVGTTIELRSIFYGNFAKIGPGGRTVKDIFLDLVQRHENAIREAVSAAIRRRRRVICVGRGSTLKHGPSGTPMTYWPISPDGQTATGR